MSVAGVGYSHGILPLAGGKLIYLATIGYCGPLNLPSPICSDETKKGDLPHTEATGKISGHKADCTIATKFDDLSKSCTIKGEDCAISTIRMFHGANLYCSSALGACVETLEEAFDLDDAYGTNIIRSVSGVTAPPVTSSVPTATPT